VREQLCGSSQKGVPCEGPDVKTSCKGAIVRVVIVQFKEDPLVREQ
jgi:hypothetical protein